MIIWRLNQVSIYVNRPGVFYGYTFIIYLLKYLICRRPIWAGFIKISNPISISFFSCSLLTYSAQNQGLGLVAGVSHKRTLFSHDLSIINLAITALKLKVPHNPIIYGKQLRWNSNAVNLAKIDSKKAKTPKTFGFWGSESLDLPLDIKKVENLALDHIISGNVTTHLVINMLLSNQKVFITANKLKELLKVKGIEFDLPITKDNLNNFYGLVGKSTYSGFAGVYIFIHKASKSMYVGSSSLLRRRLEYYFKGDFSLGGKLLPIIHKEGLSCFKLKIFKLDKNMFKPQDALLLEQYYLLNKDFNLNTLRVVNFGPSGGNSIYVYNLDCTVLHYIAESIISLKRVLGVHQSSTKKYLNSNIAYLNHFVLLSFHIPNVVVSSIEVKELKNIMDKERRLSYESGSRLNTPVILDIKKNNTFVDPSATNKLEFNSLTSCITYLHSLGLKIKRDTLSKYIKLGKVFHNFYCKYSDKSDLVSSAERERVDLLIKEYNKSKISAATIEKVNKKNKPIIVKVATETSSDQAASNEEYSFLSIMDTVRYFETRGIKLDRKMLNVYIKKGGVYKGLTFQYAKSEC